MNRRASPLDRDDDFLMHCVPYALAGLLLATAALLMMTFLSVLDDMAERGEMRRAQQRLNGSVLLVDDLRTPVVADVTTTSLRAQ